MDVFAYSPHVHEYSCKIYKLKMNNYVAGFWKTWLLSLSYKLFFSFFCSSVFGLMGCKKGILVFTPLKLHAPIIIKNVFVLQKIMDCSTGKRERRIVLMHFLLKSSRALADVCLYYWQNTLNRRRFFKTDRLTYYGKNCLLTLKGYLQSFGLAKTKNSKWFRLVQLNLTFYQILLCQDNRGIVSGRQTSAIGYASISNRHGWMCVRFNWALFVRTKSSIYLLWNNQI